MHLKARVYSIIDKNRTLHRVKIGKVLNFGIDFPLNLRTPSYSRFINGNCKIEKLKVPKRSKLTSTLVLVSSYHSVVQIQKSKENSYRQLKNPLFFKNYKVRMKNLSSSSCSTSNLISKIAVGQLTSTKDRTDNLLKCAKLAEKAAQLGCKILFLPECFSFIGNSAKDTVDAGTSLFSVSMSSSSSSFVVETNPEKEDKTIKTQEKEKKITGEDTSIVDTCKKIAKENNIWISYGGFPEKIEDSFTLTCASDKEKEIEEVENNNENDSSLSLQKPKKVYNTHLIINNQGELVSFYRKIHLFDVAVPDGPILMESRYTEAGDQLVVVPNSPIGVLGLSTCYDLRFPEMYRDLVLMGSEIILVPSAFTIPTGKAHWHTLLKARAIETQCYVIAAAQVGQHNEKRASYGHSLVIDPWGKILAEAPGVDSKPSQSLPDSDPLPISVSSNANEDHYIIDQKGSLLITADIDLSHLQKIRTNMPLANHRRYDLFPSTRKNPHQSKI